LSQHEAEDQAAAWDARLRSARATERDHHAFHDWLDEAPENEAAHERLQEALAALRAHANQPEMAALRDEARNTIHSSNRRRLVGAIVAILMVMIGCGAWLARGPQLAALMQNGTEYSTADDEQAKVTLADGSVVTLDGGTRLLARLGPSQRDITLLAGHALFQVTKDRLRPFVVTARNRTITALGTVFDVRLDQRALRVTLAEGTVAIRPVRPGNGATAILKPEQQFVETDNPGSPDILAVNSDDAVSWANGQLFFDNDTLAAAVAEMNQYSPHRKIVVDPAVAGLKISGMFHTNDLAGFTEALVAALPVAIDNRDGEIIISRRREVPDDLQEGAGGKPGR
jgi:transmembrane sensor